MFYTVDFKWHVVIGKIFLNVLLRKELKGEHSILHFESHLLFGVFNKLWSVMSDQCRMPKWSTEWLIPLKVFVIYCVYFEITKEQETQICYTTKRKDTTAWGPLPLPVSLLLVCVSTSSSSHMCIKPSFLFLSDIVSAHVTFCVPVPHSLTLQCKLIHSSNPHCLMLNDSFSMMPSAGWICCQLSREEILIIGTFIKVG